MNSKSTFSQRPSKETSSLKWVANFKRVKLLCAHQRIDITLAGLASRPFTKWQAYCLEHYRKKEMVHRYRLMKQNYVELLVGGSKATLRCAISCFETEENIGNAATRSWKTKRPGPGCATGSYWSNDWSAALPLRALQVEWLPLECACYCGGHQLLKAKEELTSQNAHTSSASLLPEKRTK